MKGWYTAGRILLGLGLILLAGAPQQAWAANPGSQSGSVGLEGTIAGAPPSQGATIAVPGNGAVFTSVPITVSGICPTGLLVKVFDNNIFVGSVVCEHGSYTIQIDLFSGQNELKARVYDALDQTGPDTNTVTVTFNDAQFLQFGTQVILTSAFAERGAPPGTELYWPIQLSGGTGPYALSVDWGDGSSSDLFSQANPGSLTIKHTYKAAGVYRVLVKATDKNGGTAFLQLVGQATGAIQSNSHGSSYTTQSTKVLWWPAVALLPLILISFWLGRRYEVNALRRRIEEAVGS